MRLSDFLEPVDAMDAYIDRACRAFDPRRTAPLVAGTITLYSFHCSAAMESLAALLSPSMRAGGALRVRDPEYWLDGLSLFRVLERTLDVVKGVELYEAVKWESAGLVQLYELRDEQLRDCIALDDAADGAAVEQRTHVDGRLRARRERVHSPSDAEVMAMTADSELDDFLNVTASDVPAENDLGATVTRVVKLVT